MFALLVIPTKERRKTVIEDTARMQNVCEIIATNKDNLFQRLVIIRGALGFCEFLNCGHLFRLTWALLASYQRVSDGTHAEPGSAPDVSSS